MTLRSFRQAAATVQLSDFSTGILNSSLNSFYTKNNGQHLSYFPYKKDGAISVRAMMEAWHWPSNYQLVSKYPNDVDDPNWSDNAQGMATTENGQWVFTSTHSLNHPRIWRLPFTSDIDQTVTPNPDVNYAGLSPSYRIGNYNHMGALGVYQNIAYVPVEYDVQANRVVRFSISESSIHFMDGAYVAQNEGSRAGASCATVNPHNETLLVSRFNTADVDSTYAIQLYSIHGPKGLDAQWPFISDFSLFNQDGSPISLSRLQGSCISPAGHLYLVVDKPASQGGGFYGFDLISGRLVRYKKIDFSTGGEFELEAITVKDFTNIPHHPTIQGQIHVLGLNNDLFESDNITIFHYTVPLEERAWI